VRRPEQAELLRHIGAVHVCDSSASFFKRDLRDAITATSATLAFDATGGGNLASQILSAMEAAAAQSATEYSRYGSNVRKQVYIYGGLDPSPTILTRTFGFAWNVGGWLLTPFLQSIGPERFAQLRQAVAAGLTTTFASSYSSEIALAQVLDPSVFSQCIKQSTGAKVLVNPQL
jgi:NADPH2:quinone reductase